METQQQKAEMVRQVLAMLPIFATQIGYRGETHIDGQSTPEERALADALFKVHETWLEVRP